MLATLDDVAKHTGYSIATVSRVVNGVDGVRSDVRNTVIQAVRELGYVARRARANQVSTPQENKERLVEVILHRHSAQEQLQTPSDH